MEVLRRTLEVDRSKRISARRLLKLLKSISTEEIFLYQGKSYYNFDTFYNFEAIN